MPGIDDLLFILASSTALLWAKRGEVLGESTYAAVAAVTNDTKRAREAADSVSRKYASPNLLLRGFDLQENYRLALAAKSDCDSGRTSAPPARGTPTDLICTSIVGEFEETAAVHEVPNVPHRHYDPSRRLPHVSVLCSYSEGEVAGQVAKYTLAEVQTVFDKMGREGLWEAAVRVSRGIDVAGLRLKYLSQRNIEAALRALFTTAHGELAVAYYFTFAEDMLLADEVVAALFDACRFSERATHELYRNMRPFKASWSPTVYACCLTANSRFDYAETLRLYEEYSEAHAAWKRAADNPFYKVMQSATLLQGTGLVRTPPAERLQYLYHIIIPLVMERDPRNVEHYVQDMMAREPEAAPDVFLRCIHIAMGRALACKYVSGLQALPSSVVAFADCGDVLSLIFSLYRMKPSAMNLNSLLKAIALLQQEKCTQDSAGVAASLQPCSAAIPQCQGGLHIEQLIRERSAELTHVFDTAPFQSDIDPHILARTITESHSSWAVATLFLTSMIHRKHFAAMPSLAHHLARQGRWPSASKAMSIYLSNQRNALPVADVSLCIEASVRAGRWGSALFWIDRAHARGLALPRRTYDIGLSASRHFSWVDALRTVTSMHDVGGTCSQRAILDVVEATSRQNKAAQVLSVLSTTGAVTWVP